MYRRVRKEDLQEVRGPVVPEPLSPMERSHPVLQRRRRGLISDEAVPFSWVQCVISVFAYIWLLSNFLRTGFAIRHLDAFHTVEPDVFANFGPYAYAGNTFSKNGGKDLGNVTSAKPAALWSYKYDTTSLALRTFAQFLNVSAFPDCIFYRSKCASDFLAPATALAMLDSLVDAVRNASTQHLRVSKLPTQDPKYHQFQPQKLLLRASYEFFDRIHHYLLPQFFSNSFWRTCQTVYYSPELLLSVAAANSAHKSDGQLQQGQQNGTLVDLCSHAYGGARPSFCDDSWTRFDRSCRPNNPKCLAVGRVSQHAARRFDKLKALYPNATVDLLLIEGIKDIALHRGGLTFVGRRGADIITIFRIRHCSEAGTCNTQLIDEYRYEGEMVAMDVLQWYPIVAILRGAAQTYYWIRLGMLYFGCWYAAVSVNDTASASVFKKAHRALVLFFKIPSQVIIYGSSFPLVCYFLAHAIDSPMVYELMGQKFDSFNGLFQLSIMELVTISSIQMRNVWVISCLVHLFVRFSTLHRWTPTRGVWGMPQFSIALISSLTILSQFRFISLRQTPVTSIQPIHVISRLHPAIESILHINGGGGKSLLGGIFLDLKAMACSTAALVLVASVVTLTVKLAFPNSRIKFIFWRSYSVTPLSAGVLWPPTSLAVSWNDDLFHFYDVGNTALRRTSCLCSKKIHPATTSNAPKAPTLRLVSQLTSRPMQLKTLDDRSEIAESVMYLMNITMLSDPVAFLSWKWSLSKISLGYYRSSETQHMYLIPLIHTLRRLELDWGDFTLDHTVPAETLSWREIITCG